MRLIVMYFFPPMYTPNELQEPNVYKNAPPYTTVKLTWRHVEKQPNVARPARLHARESFFVFPTPNSKNVSKKEKHTPSEGEAGRSCPRYDDAKGGISIYVCVKN